MLWGMVIPGDRVEEEQEGDIEGVSSDGYRTPPDFVPMSDFSPPPFLGKIERGGRPEKHSIKGMV